MAPSLNPLDHPITTSTPRRLTRFSAWHEHIPFAMFLIDVLRPRVVVELGTHYGDSYCAFCQAVQELSLDTLCYAIDTWEGDPQTSSYGPEVLADLRAHHDPLYGSFSSLVQSTFDDALAHFADRSIDLLHIDGYHTYEAVKHDYELWLPKMSDRGVMLLHDINVREANFGAWRLWDEVRSGRPHFCFAHGHGLGVLAVGEKPPEALANLFEATPSELAAMRKFFFKLGYGLTTRIERESLVQQLRERDQRSEILRAQLEDASRHVAGLSAQVAEKEQAIQAISAQVAEKEQTIQSMSAQIAEKEQTIQSMSAQIAEKEQRLQTLETRLREKQERLSLLEEGAGWKVLAKARDVRLAIAPHGSKRERGWYLALRFAMRRASDGRSAAGGRASDQPLRMRGAGELGTAYAQVSKTRRRDASGHEAPFYILRAIWRRLPLSPDVRVRLRRKLLHVFPKALNKLSQVPTRGGYLVSESAGIACTPASKEPSGDATARGLVAARFEACLPLRVFSTPAAAGTKRISIVTDSINSGSLYGGVGTAMIIAALLAEATRARLRIVTRTERAQPRNLEHVLTTYGIRVAEDVEFAFAPFYDKRYEIDFLEQERFITTSWWTTAATMASVPHASIIYLLQEDERMFYPYGDDHLRCSTVLGSREIRFVINTRLLFDHLVREGFSNVAENGVWFEPAFPASVFHPRNGGRRGKRTLMFYARPNNLRNLFYFGIDVLEEAVARGIIDLHEWDILLVGKNVPKVVISGSYVPEVRENLAWVEYAEMIGGVDLGLCLMHTPHPSYPPLDLAASGAVAVTNRFANKRDLGAYSKNIVCGDLNRESMIEALAEGVRLACDEAARGANHRAAGLCRDWRKSTSHAVQSLAESW